MIAVGRFVWRLDCLLGVGNKPILETVHTHALHLQTQKLVGVFKANIAYDRAQKFFIVREFTIFNVATEEVAEDAAEVFVAREGHEAARVRQHAYETREKAIVREGIELPLDGFFLIEKPPATTELDFSGWDAVLKGTESSGENVVVGGIDIVEDHFG